MHMHSMYMYMYTCIFNSHVHVHVVEPFGGLYLIYCVAVAFTFTLFVFQQNFDVFAFDTTMKISRMEKLVKGLENQVTRMTPSRARCCSLTHVCSILQQCFALQRCCFGAA